MIDEDALDDPGRCPSCRTALPAEPRACQVCALPLTGPRAAELWAVSSEAAALLRRRGALLAELRVAAAAPTPPAAVPPPAAATAAPLAGRTEAAPLSVRNVLLGLGVLLLAVAAVIFTAVTWGRMGIGARALVLGALTAATAGASALALRRSLTATAEALAGLAVALLLLDAYAARQVGLVDLAGPPYWATATGLLALVAGLLSPRVPLLVPPVTSVVLGQLPGLLLATERGVLGAGALLAGQGLALVPVAARLHYRHRALPVLLPAAAGAALAGSGAVGVGLVAGAVGTTAERWSAVAVLCAAAAAPAAAAAVLRPGQARHVAAGTSAAVLLAAAALAVDVAADPRRWLPMLLAGLVLGASLALRLLPSGLRPGPAVAAAAGGAAVLTLATPQLGALLEGMAGWAERPWSVPARTAARLALTTGAAPGAAPELLSVGLLAGAAALLGRGLGRRREGNAAAALLAAGALALAPALLDVPHLAAVAGQLLVAAAVALADPARPAGRLRDVAITALAALALAWALAAEVTTLLALAAVTGLAVAGAVPSRRDRAACAALAVPLAAATAGAAAASWTGARTVAGLAAVAVCAVAAVLAQTPPLRTIRLPVEAAAALAYAPALAVAATGGGAASAGLALGGVGAGAVALRTDRRACGWVSCGLMTAAAWVRLAASDVEVVEAYAVPPALALLAVGVLRRRQDPVAGSWRAYGPGLAAGLLPSLAVAVEDPGLLRPLLLGAVALTLTFVGARSGLQAPLALGGVTLGVDAVAQLWPYAAVLPRWAALGAAGLLLLIVGASYERRLRELRHLQERFAALG